MPTRMAIPAGFDPKQAHVVAQWPTERPVVCCRFEPKGRFLFCGVESSVVQRFNLADGKRVSFPGGHESWVFSLAFSADGEKTFSGGGDGRITVWETASDAPKPIRKTEAHQGWIRAMSVSPDGSLLATGGNDRVVRLWERRERVAGPRVERAPRSRLLARIPPEREDAAERRSSGGRSSSGTSPRATLVGMFDAKPLHSYNGGQQVDFGGVRGLAITPDGKFVAAGGLHKATNPLGAVHEPIALLFDGESRKNVRTHLADGITQGVIWRLRYLADGSLMGACGGGNGGFLLFWKSDADKDYHRFRPPEHPPGHGPPPRRPARRHGPP